MTGNVFFVVLDTIRVDQLRLGREADQNFLERQFSTGWTFENMVVAGNSTRISVNALFTGYYGATTGLNFHDRADAAFVSSPTPGLPEIFAHHGYTTIAVSQGDEYVPRWGFESFATFQGDMPLDRLEQQLAEAERPAFVYLHYLDVHDEAFGRPQDMTPTHYRTVWNRMSAEVEEMWHRLITPDDLVVVVSDHGCQLRDKHDPTWRFPRSEEPTGGVFLDEATVRGICTFVAPGRFPQRRVTNLTRSIDVLPTLLDVLDLAHPIGQGRSVGPDLDLDSLPPVTAYAEAGGRPDRQGRSPARLVCDERWRYHRYETWGEGLHDRIGDPSGRHDLLGTAPEIERRLRELMAMQMAANEAGVSAVQGPTRALAERILAHRGAWPEVERGPRGSCFDGMIDDVVRAHLVDVANTWLPRRHERGERIVLYSASEHAAAFLDAVDPAHADALVGVVDSDPTKAGSTWRGLPVERPEDFDARFEPTIVLVAHYFYANDMYVAIKERVVRPVSVRNVYRPDVEIPIWWDRDGHAHPSTHVQVGSDRPARIASIAATISSSD